MSTSTSLLTPSYVEATKFGLGPDYSIYTGGMRPMRDRLPEADKDRPVLFMVGSSTVEDLQGDIMTLSALQDMTTIPDNLTIFLNHSYDLPDDAYGALYRRPSIEMSGKVADFLLAVEAFLSNPPAARTYNLVVKEGARFGCSIGCNVLEWDFAEPDNPNSSIVIKHVDTLEFSVVGIPANQRSWVENAIRGLFAKSLVTGNADEARRLASAYKSLYPRNYEDVLHNLTSAGLRKELTAIRARGDTSSRILYDFTDGREGFAVRQRGGLLKSLSRDVLEALIEDSAKARAAYQCVEDTPVVTRTPDVDEDGEAVTTAVTDATTDTAKGVEPDTVKDASGKTDWPLAALDTEWTGSKAEQQIFTWARNADGEIVASKARQCFLWVDPAKADVQAGYKMPYCYVSGDSPKIVPLGVRACANVLNGGMGGGNFSGDDAAMKAKVKTLYGRINRELHPDPEWQVSWDKDTKEKAGGGVLDTTTGNDLARQDLGEDEDTGGSEADSTMTINEDGTHAAFTGTHSHAHASYSSTEPMHEHEHEHDDDAHHGHLHERTKAGMPDAKDVKVSADGMHPACKGIHAHTHKAFGSQGNDAMHDHEHAHDGNAMHDHEHAHDGNAMHDHEHAHDGDVQEEKQEKQEKQDMPVAQKSVLAGDASDPRTLATLALYNDLGKHLGLASVSLDATKCNLVGTPEAAQAVISTLSNLDEYSDQMMSMAQAVDARVDTLMRLLGVPDEDDDDGNEQTSMPSPLAGMTYSNRPILRKDGREFSEKNRNVLKAMHDTCAMLHDMIAVTHPDACKCGIHANATDTDGTAHQDGATTVDEATQMVARNGQGSTVGQGMVPVGYSFEGMTTFAASLDGLTKSLEGLHVKALEDQVGGIRTKVLSLNAIAADLQQTFQHLTNMPLGRPTHLTRSVNDSRYALDNVATYDEMARAGMTRATTSHAESLGQTRIVQKGDTTYRLWPAGVGAGNRPALSIEQKSLMHPAMWECYDTAARDVLVPCIDDVDREETTLL